MSSGSTSAGKGTSAGLQTQHNWTHCNPPVCPTPHLLSVDMRTTFSKQLQEEMAARGLAPMATSKLYCLTKSANTASRDPAMATPSTPITQLPIQPHPVPPHHPVVPLAHPATMHSVLLLPPPGMTGASKVPLFCSLEETKRAGFF